MRGMYGMMGGSARDGAPQGLPQYNAFMNPAQNQWQGNQFMIPPFNPDAGMMNAGMMQDPMGMAGMLGKGKKKGGLAELLGSGMFGLLPSLFANL